MYTTPLPPQPSPPPYITTHTHTQDRLYARARELGITLLTVAHRRALWRHHDYLLLLDGKGGWSFRLVAEADEEPEKGGGC